MVAASVNASLKPSKLPKAASIAPARSPEGAPPPLGPITVQNSVWLAWPPPWFCTAARLPSGTEPRLLRMDSIDWFSRSVPATASFSLPT